LVNIVDIIIGTNQHIVSIKKLILFDLELLDPVQMALPHIFEIYFGNSGD